MLNKHLEMCLKMYLLIMLIFSCWPKWIPDCISDFFPVTYGTRTCCWKINKTSDCTTWRLIPGFPKPPHGRDVVWLLGISCFFYNEILLRSRSVYAAPYKKMFFNFFGGLTPVLALMVVPEGNHGHRSKSLAEILTEDHRAPDRCCTKIKKAGVFTTSHLVQSLRSPFHECHVVEILKAELFLQRDLILCCKNFEKS